MRLFKDYSGFSIIVYGRGARKGRKFKMILRGHRRLHNSCLLLFRGKSMSTTFEKILKSSQPRTKEETKQILLDWRDAVTDSFPADPEPTEIIHDPSSQRTRRRQRKAQLRIEADTIKKAKALEIHLQELETTLQELTDLSEQRVKAAVTAGLVDSKDDDDSPSAQQRRDVHDQIFQARFRVLERDVET